MSEKFRLEKDLLGEKQVPQEALYGVQTLRALENFKISENKLCHYPYLIKGLAITKKGAAIANYKLNLISKEQHDAILQACDELIAGKHHENFPVDMIQGGAGTSVNMNANEVIANRALEIMGHQRGEYQYCSPNDVINASQSTNDAYPTAMKIGILFTHLDFKKSLTQLIDALDAKANAFDHIIKMGRTQLQDAVPMTMGQTFRAFANAIRGEMNLLSIVADEMLTINMGGTAIGTGICAEPGYEAACLEAMKELTGWDLATASDLVYASSDTGAFVTYSSALKRMSVKIGKICNDLRLMSSGPRCGLGEINLPEKQPGSSIMPGKVNPVIPEVVNQICFKVIGNDLAVTMAAEAAQLELNVMEPVIVASILESLTWLSNGCMTLKTECIDGITVNEEHCQKQVFNSIGIVTALNPYLGYKKSTEIAKEAKESGRGVYELVLEHKLLTKEQLDKILSPENMTKPVFFNF